MEADHGELVNEETGAAIGVLRQGHKWAVDLDDLAAASATIEGLDYHNTLQQFVQAKAVIYSIPKSIRQKVISLHERMGHANTEAMCDALAGEAPSWTHTDITPNNSSTEGDEAPSMPDLPPHQTPKASYCSSLRRSTRCTTRILFIRRYCTSLAPIP